MNQGKDEVNKDDFMDTIVGKNLFNKKLYDLLNEELADNKIKKNDYISLEDTNEQEEVEEIDINNFEEEPKQEGITLENSVEFLEEPKEEKEKHEDVTLVDKKVVETDFVEEDDENISVTKNYYALTSKKLIISEKEKKVFLPYTIDDVQYGLQYEGYQTADDVIEGDFSVPLKKYSNHSFSRFREGFKLMKNKEKSSFSKAFLYGLDLMAEKKLHPAVITACKTQDELETFLACMEGNHLDLFDKFEVEYKINPRKKERFE